MQTNEKTGIRKITEFERVYQHIIGAFFFTWQLKDKISVNI